MGSQLIQGKLWGQRAKDWANIQEETGHAGYVYVLDHLQIKQHDKLLDLGCGTGLFCSMAVKTGAQVTGIDASEALIGEAAERTNAVKFSVGEMEALPFGDEVFDVVCGFNSYQYAASTLNALRESFRVLKPGGKFAAMIWGNKEDCEAATYLKAIGGLLPPPPPGAPGPFALSENSLLEDLLQEAGFSLISSEDIKTIWDYANLDIALKGLLSVGPAAKAIESNGFSKVYDAVSNAVKPYTQANRHVVYKNKFRVVIAKKQ